MSSNGWINVQEQCTGTQWKIKVKVKEYVFYLHGSALELLIEGRGVEMGEECCAEAGEDHKGHVVECPTAFHAEEGLSGDREGVEELAAGTVGPRHRGEERAMRVVFTFVIVCVWRGGDMRMGRGGCGSGVRHVLPTSLTSLGTGDLGGLKSCGGLGFERGLGLET